MRAARMARGTSLRALARQVGMSASALSDFETGRSRPSDARLAVLSEALGVPLPPKPVPRTVPPFRHWREYDERGLDRVSTAGLALFVERGFHGSSVRMIADRSGMAVAGLYHHVPSKQELLLRLLRRALTELVARCAAADAEAMTPRQRVANLTECLVRFHVYRGDWAYLIANEMRYLDSAAYGEMLAERRRVLQLFVNAVADCRIVPGAASERVTAKAILSMCAVIPDWGGDAGRPEPDELVEQFVGLALVMV